MDPHPVRPLISGAVSGGPRNDQGEESPKSGAETARKVLQLLLQFNHSRPTATVRELADASGLSLPTAHRYVALLKDMGLIEESRRASYQLGWRVLQLAQAARAATGLAQVAEPVMTRLVEEIDESVTLLQLTGLDMQCIGQVESEHVVRLTFKPGQRLPLTAGASARVLLASLSDDERTRRLDALAAGDPDFAARRERFEGEIEEASGQGWAISREEIDRGIWAVSAPIKEGPVTVAALAVAGPLYRLEAGMQQRVVDLATSAAEEIGRNLASGTAA
jgi:DNA-binding IclR family transcriptional regulator